MVQKCLKCQDVSHYMLINAVYVECSREQLILRKWWYFRRNRHVALYQNLIDASRIQTRLAMEHYTYTYISTYAKLNREWTKERKEINSEKTIAFCSL